VTRWAPPLSKAAASACSLKFRAAPLNPEDYPVPHAARCRRSLADPNAAGFYERYGAVRIGEAPSDAVPDRLLPLL
jgi:hypothetical protein